MPPGIASEHLPAGPWDPAAWEAGHGRPAALLVADGLLLRELLLQDGGAAELLGPGDVVALDRPAEELLPVEARWTVAVACRVVPLGEDLVETLQTHPALVAQLVGRSVDQAERQALHRAIVQLPRVEQRVLGLLWLLAQRWGRVGPGGVVLPIALTHQTLGRLAGARRSTVTLALKALAAEGSVERRLDGTWLLARQGIAQLEPTGVTARTHVPAMLQITAEEAASTVPSRMSEVATEVDALGARMKALREQRIAVQEHSQLVLARCRTTREQVQAARERRAAERLRPGSAPPRAGSLR